MTPISVIKVFVLYLSFVLILSVGVFAANTNTDKQEQDFSESVSELVKSWRGFNLEGKYTIEWSNDGYHEEDFRMISENGFNFIRLLVDYRTYTSPYDRLSFNEDDLQEFDNAVNWGQKYNLHISINLHRAPGYCIHDWEEPEKMTLWDNEQDQEDFIRHWQFFANRYRDIGWDRLSFNLINEPFNVDEEKYIDLMQRTIDAIRTVSPERIIIVDGVETATKMIYDVDRDNVVISRHVYEPFLISHYKASWVGIDYWPEPEWPFYPISKFFYGPYKPVYQSELKVKGSIPEGTEIEIGVNQVSISAGFYINADGENVFYKSFLPGPGEGEWKEVVYNEQYNVYQNIYDTTYQVTLSEPCDELSFGVETGDWTTVNGIKIIFPDGNDLIFSPTVEQWGIPMPVYEFLPGNKLNLSVLEDYRSYYDMDYIKEFREAAEQGYNVMIGEFGVYNKTPHDVTLNYLKWLLDSFKDAGIGWCMFEWDGTFGVLDSERTDVEYEQIDGRRLDRKMMNLLREYP